MKSGESITCPGCGKKYAFKPEYAGRKLKCKCGTSIAVPAATSADDEGADDAGAYDVVEAAPAPAAPRPTAPSVAPIPRAGMPTPGGSSRKADSKGPDFSNGFGAKSIGGGIIGFIVLIGVTFKLIRVVFFPRDRDRQTSTAVAPAPETEAVEPAPSQDTLARQMMQRDAMADMSTWLNSPPTGKSLGAYSVREVRELYEKTWTRQLGIKRVLAPNNPRSSSVIFVLPEDKAARKAVFDWQEKWHREQGAEVIKDAGDKMLIISMPLTKRSE